MDDNLVMAGDTLPVLAGVKPEHLEKPDDIEWIDGKREGSRYFLAMLDVRRVRVYESGMVLNADTYKTIIGVKPRRVTLAASKNNGMSDKQRGAKAILDGLVDNKDATWEEGLTTVVKEWKKIAKKSKSDTARVSAINKMVALVLQALEWDRGGAVPLASEGSVLGQLENVLELAYKIKVIDHEVLSPGDGIDRV